MTISRCVKDGQTVLGVSTGGGGVRFRNLVLGIIAYHSSFRHWLPQRNFDLETQGRSVVAVAVRTVRPMSASSRY